jgi:hypothetical protein
MYQKDKKRRFRKIGKRKFFIVNKGTKTEINNRIVRAKVITTNKIISKLLK